MNPTMAITLLALCDEIESVNDDDALAKDSYLAGWRDGTLAALKQIRDTIAAMERKP